MNKTLNQLRKDIFEAAFDENICGYATINELADAAGLCWTTVQNFYERKTKRPGFFTIKKLAIAVGMDLELVKEEFANVE